MKFRKLLIGMVVVSVSFLIAQKYSNAELCQKWSKGEKIGKLDSSFINEASGIAISRKYPKRMYHINDSGDGPFFYVSDLKGKKTKKVRFGKFDPVDLEDLTIGSCYENKSCLFVGDIGDNFRSRSSIQIYVIEEQEEWGDKTSVINTVTVKYPLKKSSEQKDLAKNCEAMALHPNGDLYFFSKEDDLEKRKAFPTKIFRLKKTEWEKKTNQSNEASILEYVGEIDLPFLAFLSGFPGRIVTSADISPDGKRFLLLTYDMAYEFKIDLSKIMPNSSPILLAQKMVPKKDFVIIDIKKLVQQESIAYFPDGKSFVYNSETKGHKNSARILKVECRK